MDVLYNSGVMTITMRYSLVFVEESNC